MAPDDYKIVRNANYGVAWIDDRPYLPQTVLDLPPSDDNDNTMSSDAEGAAGGPQQTLFDFEESIAECAASIMVLHFTKVTSAAAVSSSSSKPIDWNVTSVAKALTVERVRGGCTNVLYKVSGFAPYYEHYSTTCCGPNPTATSPTNPSPLTPTSDTVLVRLFGAEGLIDRDVETSVYAALAQRNIAPPYYGRFGNGRLEGWCPAPMRALETEELPRYAPAIATSLRQLHQSFAVPSWLYPNSVAATGSGTSTATMQPSVVSMWTQLYDWFDQAAVATFANPEHTQCVADLQIAAVLRPQLDALKARVEETVSLDTVVFCHNDLLAANIMVDPKNDSNNDTQKNIQLIDFEYGGPNYRSFDIANHFNEYAGGPPTTATPDYQRLPTSDDARIFLTAYLDDDTTNAAANVETVWAEVQLFLLINHLYWGLWAINQAATEGCDDYDYMLYGQCRIRQFEAAKQVQENDAAAVKDQ